MTTTRDRLLAAAQELQASKEKSLIALVDAFEAAEVAATGSPRPSRSKRRGGRPP